MTERITNNPSLVRAKALYEAHSRMSDDGCPHDIPKEIFKAYEEAETAELNRVVTKAVTFTAPNASTIDSGSPGNLPRRVRNGAISADLVTDSLRARRIESSRGGFGGGLTQARSAKR